MATPADQRLLELLGKWLASLELHAKYCSLDDGSYSKVQPWPEHQRPSRWIIDLAKQKALALKGQIDERVKMGDTKFSDSLELMTFLANLVGSEHIERFIPLAEPANERPLVADPPAQTAITAADSATGTREMPRFVGGKGNERPPTATATVVRTERKAADAAPASKAAAKGAAKSAERSRSAPEARPAGGRRAEAPPLDAPAPATPGDPVPTLAVEVPSKAAARAGSSKAGGNTATAAAKPSATGSGGTVYNRDGPTEAVREQVIADAARLVQWGRKWYELAELIASMADRPHVTDIRRILKDNKAVIDERAGRL
jgi:hypothetical protein